MICAGIDEAGYGPTLGPLCVVCVRVTALDEAAVHAAFATSATGVRDSKQLHRSGDIAPLEAVCMPALAWLSGTLPATAAAVFALLGEGSAERSQAPWMAGAESLRLPLTADIGSTWTLDGVLPAGLAGHILHPQAYNRGIRSGINKAELELGLVRTLLGALPSSDATTTVVDRLGGRRYYRDLVQSAWPEEIVLIEQEDPDASRYQSTRSGRLNRVSFLVGGESHSPLTALASCIAKYARELHLHLFNAWFCARHPGLRPTAGYPEDAKRWLSEIPSAERQQFAETMIRTERGRSPVS